MCKNDKLQARLDGEIIVKNTNPLAGGVPLRSQQFGKSQKNNNPAIKIDNVIEEKTGLPNNYQLQQNLNKKVENSKQKYELAVEKRASELQMSTMSERLKNIETQRIQQKNTEIEKLNEMKREKINEMKRESDENKSNQTGSEKNNQIEKNENGPPYGENYKETYIPTGTLNISEDVQCDDFNSILDAQFSNIQENINKYERITKELGENDLEFGERLKQKRTERSIDY